MMKLIIISGAPATGKTTIAQKLSNTSGYPLYSKDSIKEALHDTNQGPKHGFLWYEERSKDKLFQEAQNSLAKNKITIIESNFIKADRPRLQALIKQDFQVVEIYCFTKGYTRLARFIKRSEHGTRHKVYGDRKWYLTTFIETTLNYIGVSWPYDNTGTTNKVLRVDTSDFSSVNFRQIADFTK